MAFLGVDTDVWITIGVIAAPFVVAMFFGAIFVVMRGVEDRSFARQFGWSDAASMFASERTFDPTAWVPHRLLSMTRQLDGRGIGRRWKNYVNCDTQVLPNGFALRYRGRLRVRSMPKDHPVLVFPWASVKQGLLGDLKGDGRYELVAMVQFHELAHVGLAFQRADAERIAAESRGQWTITPAPPEGKRWN